MFTINTNAIATTTAQQKDLPMSATTTTTITTDKDLPMSEATTTTPNQQKDLPMIDFDFSQLSYLTENFDEATIQADLSSIKEQYATFVKDQKMVQLNELQRIFNEVKDNYYYEASNRLDEIEQESSDLEELENQIDEVINMCSFSNVESHLVQGLYALKDHSQSLSDEKESLEEVIEFFDEIEANLDEIRENLIEQIPVVNQGDDLPEEITKMSDEEHRLTWEGANAQDIALLVNKILTNKELATHLALEAIKAEKILNADSCPNGQFSK